MKTLTNPARLRPAWPLALLAALLAFTAPVSRAAPTAVADASYLARGPSGLQLALVVRDGRVQAYACDGRARKAYFTGRAGGGELVLHGRGGARLALRLGARSAAATLTLPDGEPLALTARPARVAIFAATVRRNGVVTASAPGGGALAAHLSAAGLYGALALPGERSKSLVAPRFAKAPLYVDGRRVRYSAGKAAQALRGPWRWIVTPTRIVGATTQVLDLGNPWGIAAGTKFIDLNSDL